MRFADSCMTTVVIIVLAIGFSIASLRSVQPANCQTLCDEPERAPCPTGSCRFGEQHAGFPFPVIRDSEVGSPTGGWGKIGPEDYFYANLAGFVGDVLFYSVLLWLLGRTIQIIRGNEKPQAIFAMALPFTFVLVGLIVGFLNYVPTRLWLSPSTSEEPEDAILGKWRATDDPSGGEAIFRFYQGGRVTVSAHGSGQIPGEYRWVGDHQILMFFFAQTTWLGGDTGFCPYVPSLLKGVCHTKIVNQASYPAPAGSIAPTVTIIAGKTATSDPGVYPGPPPLDIVFSRINEVFAVALDANTLTLTHSSGSSEIFHRVTGD